MKKPPSLRAQLNTELKKRTRTNIATYGVRFNTGDVRLQVNDVCHARAKLCSYADVDLLKKHKNLEVVELSNLIVPFEEPDKEKFNKWVKYIIQESFFADVFLTKNVSAARRYGVQMNVEKSMSAVVAGLIALREGWEFPHILDNFTLLVKNGVNKNVAYLLSRMVTATFQQSGYGGHQAIGKITIENAKELIHKGLNYHNAPLKINKNAYSIFEATRSKGYPNEEDSLHSLLYKGAEFKGTGWNKVNTLTEKLFIDNAKKIEELLNA